jgi:hypothetical protein
MHEYTNMGTEALNNPNRCTPMPINAAGEEPKHSSWVQPASKWAISIRTNPAIIENLPIAAIIGAYILAVYVVHAAFGIHDKLVVHLYYDWFTKTTIVFCGLFTLINIRKKAYLRYFEPRCLLGFMTVFLLAPLFKSAFASFKQTIPLIHLFSWDVSLMQIYYYLHFGHHPWRLLEPILYSPLAVQFIDYVYVSWFVFLAVSCLWMALSKRRHLRLCFLVSTLLVWSLLGSFLGTVLSSAGPCYYSEVVMTGDNPFAPLMARLSEISQDTHLWATWNQFVLSEAKRYDTWLPFGGISAMPSIHLAMTTLFTLLAFEVRKWLGWVFMGYTLIMQIGSVILGWHYAVDGYAGIVLACAIWYAVRKAVKWVLPSEAALPDASA